MQTQNKGGDVLASGAVRNTFQPMGGKVSQEKWDAMWENYDPSKPAEFEGGTGEKETTTTGVPR